MTRLDNVGTGGASQFRVSYRVQDEDGFPRPLSAVVTAADSGAAVDAVRRAQADEPIRFLRVDRVDPAPEPRKKRGALLLLAGVGLVVLVQQMAGQVGG